MFTKTAARLVIAGILSSSLAFGQSPDTVVTRVLSHPRIKIAQEFVGNDHARLVREIIQITEIEAPPFAEEKRGRVFLEMLRQHGLTNVEMDPEGNVMGLRKGTGDGPLLAIAAHLDTVFPAGTDVKVKRDGTRLMAPGVGDDSRALAVLLAIIRAMDAAKIETNSDILFVGDVGEEGPGDLRGMKYLFQKGRYKNKIQMFISIDGAGPGVDVTIGAVASKRYRVTFKGPGGHSYGAFGFVNPAYALANAIEKFSMLQVPSNPRTTFNVGVIGGGTSVNSIPFESWMEVDMRSESNDELNKTVASFLSLVQKAAEEENAERSTAQGKIDVDVKLIGDRPAGSTPIGSTIVQTASAVIRSFGLVPSANMGSTDANIPISMNIPAITIDSGGRGGRTHALDEWIDVEKTSSVKGINVAMGILLSLAGVRYEHSMLKDFKEFVMRGNVLDLAVAVIIGGAFGKIVTSFVNDILMPPIGLAVGRVDFSNLFIDLSGGGHSTIAAAKAAGAATLNYGLFINAVIDFTIVAFAIFLLVRQINRLAPKPARPRLAQRTVPFVFRRSR